jgi:glyoxylase-like metal-dependent hydrolase (beta-lactamase superfamily II)
MAVSHRQCDARRWIVVPALMVSLSRPAFGAPDHPALDAVAQAMGGKARVLGIRTLLVEGSGTVLFFGQTLTPFAKTNITVTTFRRAYDFANRRWIAEQIRESRYLTPVPPPLRVRLGLDGDVAYNIVGDGPMARAPANVAADRSAELVYHPIGFVQAAYAEGNEVTEDRDGSEDRIHLSAGGRSYTMHLDRRTHLPTRISRRVDHLMLGDVSLDVLLSDWNEAGDGIRLPMRIAQREDRWVLSDYRFATARTNVDPGPLTATDSVRAAVPDGSVDGPAMTIDVEEIAPGIWSLAGPPFNGGVYHTIAIEQSDHVALVEAPENDARTLAILARARALRPGKPLGPMVNTHHHFDHAGGVRAAISQGLTIITHEANRDFYERVVYPRPHTIQPDALQRNPRPLALRSVRGKLVLKDSLRSIELYQVRADQHSGSMLMVYLPTERVLIQADLNRAPGPAGDDPARPFAPALVESVRRWGLRVERVVGIHGPPIPWPAR